jgi:hypothetical protein
MLLVQHDGDYHLLDDHGTVVATSSSLQSVLDALGGGVAQRVRPVSDLWTKQVVADSTSGSSLAFFLS